MTASETLKRLCDRVWHEKLWDVMQKINIEKGLVQVIEVSAGLPGNQIGFGHLISNIPTKKEKKNNITLPSFGSIICR